MEMVSNAELSKWTTIKIGGRCLKLCFPETVDDLKGIIKLSKDKNLPIFILGRGANTIFGDIKGIVINLIKLKKDPEIYIGREGIEISLYAGNSLSDLINIAIDKNLKDVFKLYGFPATIGGAIAMNAGAYGYEISEDLLSVDFIDWEGNKVEMERGDIDFNYRNSPFPQMGVVVKARFFLKFTERNVKDEISNIKQKRLESQPINALTSGSTFKNPKNISAGFLLDKHKLKGKKLGNVMFSNKHANFLINLGSGKIEEVKGLINMAKKIIWEEEGIKLEEEVRIIEDSGIDGWKIL